MQPINVLQTTSKEERYLSLFPQIQALVSGETDRIANMSNVAAALKEAFHFWWVGFYIVKDNTLVLGPFQGPVACTRIAFGKGVCGKAWESGTTQIVPDVDLFPGHISCSSQSRSEMVIPVKKGGDVVAVLDIDSEFLNMFDDIDRLHLETILSILDF